MHDLMMGSIDDPTGKFLVEWAEDRIPESRACGGFGKATAIGVVEKGRLIAVAVFHNYRKHDIEISFAADSPRWAQRGVIRAIFHYVFVQLGCARLTTITAKANKRARKLDEGLGFKLEGVHPKAQSNGGTSISYGMTREDVSRWLDLSPEK